MMKMEQVEYLMNELIEDIEDHKHELGRVMQKYEIEDNINIALEYHKRMEKLHAIIDEKRIKYQVLNCVLLG